MLRHASRPRAWFKTLASFAPVLVASTASAQTIADYSRAQRAMLESVMSQAAARSAGMAASAPVVPASSATAAAAPSPRVLPQTPSLAVHVSGIFASREGAVAEVVVNTTAYLLGVGQGVPGTAWRVETIAVDRVVLDRQGSPGAVDGDGLRRVFSLPALR